MTNDKIPIESLLADIDTFIHEPVRLGVLTILSIHKAMPFSEIQKALRITPGNLNSHITKLAEKGYVTIEKQFVELRPRTIIFITKTGKLALLRYVNKFKELIQTFNE